jgi:hypothetical protein
MENCCAVNLQWRFRAVNARLPKGRPLLRIETSVFGEATVVPQLGFEHLEWSPMKRWEVGGAHGRRLRKSAIEERPVRAYNP